MKKNIASQSVGAQMTTASDGTDFTGTVTVVITIDNGTQSSSGGTAPAHKGNGYHSYTPTQAETNGDYVSFTFTGSGAITRTVSNYATTAIVDDVWDRVLTGATHNINTSAGKRLRQVSAIIFSDGTAQAGGGANSIILEAGAITSDDEFNRAKIIITGGLGEGQEAIITDSVASTDTVTVTPSWPISNPDATTEYQIIPAQVHATVRNGGYDNGFVYIDIPNGSAGTEKGVNGTSTNKSSVLADARTVADNENIRKFMISGGGNFSLDQAYTDWIFDQTNAALIDFNSKDVGGSVFFRAGITGIALNGTDRVSFRLCGIINCTLGTATATSSTLSGTITLSAEDRYLFLDCAEGSTTPPIIDVAGDGITETLVTIGNYSGRIEIQNMTAVDEVYVSGGVHLTLNANCSGGTLVRAGDIKITDNSGNVTITNGMVADTLVDTGTTLPAQITALNDISVSDVLTTQMTEAYAANGIAPTMAQSLFAIHQLLMEFSISGTTYTVKKLDSATTAFVVTLDDATNPTGNTR
jgi:hypothetical protein